MTPTISQLLESLAQRLTEGYSEMDMTRFKQAAMKSGNSELAAYWDSRIKRRIAAGDVVMAKSALKRAWGKVRASDARLADAGEGDLYPDEEEEYGIAPAKREIGYAKSALKQAIRSSKPKPK